MYTHQAVWWPVGIVWIIALAVNSEQIRYFFELTSWLSMGGPFLMYWVSFAYALINAQTYNLWGDWLFYTLISLFFVYSGVSIFYQLVMIEKIAEWVPEGFKKKDAAEEEAENILEEVETAIEETVEGDPIADFHSTKMLFEF